MTSDYPEPKSRDRVIEAARIILEKNSKTGRSAIHGREFQYRYVCPAIKKYPHQWLWDSCFHAIVLSRFDPEAAQAELESLLMGMEANGFMPNMILWEGTHSLLERFLTHFFVSGKTSNITQSPVLALAIEEVFGHTKDLDFVRQCLPRAEKFYRWLEVERDRDGDKLVSIIHPWEALDASPVFDPLIGIAEPQPSPWKFYRALYGLLNRYAGLGWDEERIFASGAFDVEHVMFNCIYAQGLRAISRLYHLLDNSQDAQLYDEKAHAIEQAIVEICWNEEAQLFFDVTSPAHRQLEVSTISSLFPLILDEIPSNMVEALVAGHLLNEDEFWLPYPLPSVSKAEPAFEPADQRLLWRGPTWINTNWFIMRGLHKHGYADVARDIAKRSIRLVDQAGFWEFYNPFTGEGGGQEEYSWSTLVLGMFDHL